MLEPVWKYHDSGTCPVPPKAYVFVSLRNDAGYHEAISRGSSLAYRLRWDDLKSGGDILAYAIDDGRVAL